MHSDRANAGWSQSDMALFYKNMAEPSYNIKDVGPYSTNGGPDAESSLDIQFGGALAYVTRTNTEFAKVTARGITLVAASGDQGAPGDK